MSHIISPTTESIIDLTSSVSVYGESSARWLSRIHHYATTCEDLDAESRLRLISRLLPHAMGDLEKIADAHNRACEAEGFTSRMTIQKVSSR